LHQENDDEKGNEKKSQDNKDKNLSSIDVQKRKEVLAQYFFNQLKFGRQNGNISLNIDKKKDPINSEEEKCNSDNKDSAYSPMFFERLHFTIENLFITKFTPETLKFIFINRCMPVSHPLLTLKKEKKSDYARIAVMLGFSCSEARYIFNKPIQVSDIPKTEKRFKNSPNPLYFSIMEFVKEFNLPFLHHKF